MKPREALVTPAPRTVSPMCTPRFVIVTVAAASLLVAAVATGARASAGRPPSEPVIETRQIVVRGGGFDWPEAGIGAAAGVGATLAVFGGAALARNSRLSTRRSS